MCGIFGFVNLSGEPVGQDDAKAARKALDGLEHRGPDQSGEHIHGPVYIGHRRLSILDLSDNARQPMVTDDVVVAVNGEIYNFQQIRDELGAEKFRSTSDSEVVLHGTSEWGLEKLLARMDGMYAGVAYDKKTHQLHLFRDRAGIKPLYYALLDGKLLFSSELKAIQVFFSDNATVLSHDPTALYDFLTYRYIPAPKTAYKNVFKLLPCSFLCLNLHSGNYKTERYWSLPVSGASVNHDTAAEELRALCGSSVKSHLISDVPVGFFLSGGLDSSVVVAEAAKHVQARTFSIGYTHKAHDETGYADIVANLFKTEHHKKILDSADCGDLVQQVLNWYDEPFADNSALPTYHVSHFAKENVTVALSGDGGDELFGGYRWYQRFYRRRFLQPFIDPLQLYNRLLRNLSQKAKAPYRGEFEIPDDYDDLWFFRKYWREDLPLRKRLQYLDFHTFLPDDILTKVDRVSMAVSLEVRVPLLSRALMEFAFSMPEDFLYKNGALKGGLKYAYRDILPDEIINRPKKGFSIPFQAWKQDMSLNEGSLQEAVLNRFLDIS